MEASEKGVLKNSSIIFNSPSEAAKSMLFYFIAAGSFICDENYEVNRKSYASFLLMHIYKGEGTLVFGGNRYEIKENDLVLIDCSKPHRYYTKTGWKTRWIHFDGNLSRKFFKYITAGNRFVIPAGKNTEIPRRIAGFTEKILSPETTGEPLVSSEIHRMLSEIMMLNKSGPVSRSIYNSEIIKAQEFIRSNFHKNLSVSDVAEHAGLSMYHFSRLFKSQTGYSPYEYITKVRIVHGKDLLRNTGMYIKEISAACGFSCESSFIVAFRNITGMSPGYFRKMPF